MILTVIIVSFTPMLLVICILLHQFRASCHEKTYAHLSELVQKHKQNIDSFLNEKLANIRFLAISNSGLPFWEHCLPALPMKSIILWQLLRNLRNTCGFC